MKVIKKNISVVDEVMQASKEELTLMLYNFAIKACDKAIIAIYDNDFSEAHNNIIKVEMIIEELQVTLKPNYEVSHNFELMYDYLQRRLYVANVSKDIKILEEVNKFIREIRDTWKEAIDVSKGNRVLMNKMA